MMDNTITTDKQLISRARSVRNRYVKRDREVAVALNRLCDAGRVALIGGALRELHFLPPAQFTSDLDFVVEVQDAAAFKQVIAHYDARPNKFGGYGLDFHGGIRIDFWSAQDTWANVEGHKNVSRLEDVVETTFFNVDALLYVLGENRLIAKEGTLEALNKRFLDVNLLPNPNPAGAAVRAIRKLVMHHMRASGSLLNFIADQIDTIGWQNLSNLDANAYPHRPLLRHVCNRNSWSGDSFVKYARANDDQLISSKQLVFDFCGDTHQPHLSAQSLDERF